jgi:predicted membrane-bound mannosyltransferase
MIKNDQELQATVERIRYFQQQVEKLRQVETNPSNYRLSASGYLAEIDRMNLAVREYLWLHPSEVADTALPVPTP